MEKKIFLDTLRDRLTAMELPKKSVEKHVNIFNNCFNGKNDDEINQIIEGAGGIDGIVQSVCDLYKAKQKSNTETVDSYNDSKTISTTDESEISSSEQLDDIAIVSEENGISPSYSDQETADINQDSIDTPTDNPPTIEMPKAPNIEEHIREAEEMSETLERIPVPTDTEAAEELSAELSDYDFEKLFAEKLTLPEKWVKKLREKMSDKVFYGTLPLSILAFAFIYAVSLVLFPIVLCTAIVCSVVYICLLVAGVCFTIVPVGYGIYMCFKSMPIAMYELSIGAISAGVTMFSCILLYNYVKRLVPFIFKQLIKLFKLCVKISKRYFKKPVKEEN